MDYDNFHIIRKPSGPVVIFDDFVTTGSSMCAATRKLRDMGVSVVGRYALVEVLNPGERGGAPEWRTVTRELEEDSDSPF
jgi:orotate phosphoribosyltransferase